MIFTQQWLWAHLESAPGGWRKHRAVWKHCERQRFVAERDLWFFRRMKKWLRLTVQRWEWSNPAHWLMYWVLNTDEHYTRSQSCSSVIGCQKQRSAWKQLMHQFERESHLRAHQQTRTHAFLPLLLDANIAGSSARQTRSSPAARSPHERLRVRLYTGGVAGRGSHAHAGPRSRDSSVTSRWSMI